MIRITPSPSKNATECSRWPAAPISMCRSICPPGSGSHQHPVARPESGLTMNNLRIAAMLIARMPLNASRLETRMRLRPRSRGITMGRPFLNQMWGR